MEQKFDFHEFLTKVNNCGISVNKASEIYRSLYGTGTSNKESKKVFCNKSNCKSAACLFEQECCEQTESKFANNKVKIKELEELVRKQKHALKYANENNAKRNKELDALHYIWCDGGCKGGVHRFTELPPIDEELVSTAEYCIRRLRTWFVNAHPVDKKIGDSTFRSWKYPPWYWRWTMKLTDLVWCFYKKRLKK